MTAARSNIGDGDLTVADILRHGARWHADRQVRTVGADQSTLSYAELAARAGQLAHGLAGLGIGAGDTVGSVLWNTREHLEAYLGVPAMGALLHTVNPRLSVEQIAFTIRHAEDRVLLVDRAFVDQVVEVLPHTPGVRAVVVVGGDDADPMPSSAVTTVGYSELLAGCPTDYAWPRLDERAGATLCYTTGTTGDPKGVAYSHRSIWIHALSLCTANAVAVSARDIGYIVVPMYHANAWGYPYATYWAGGDLLLCNADLAPATVVDAVARYRPTYSNGVPTVWNAILDHVRQDPSRDLDSLDRVVLGGAPIPAALREGLADYGVEALQGWGMTETSPLVTLNRPPVWRTAEQADENAEADERRAGGQGRVLPGVDIRLVDPDSGDVLPPDGATVGELELRGPWIADSYHRGVGEEKFHDGWLRTGDVGTLDPRGYVQLTDRAKDVIKSGGEWISSVELELEIARHPDVTAAAVIGVPDDRWDERPCALVVLRPGAQSGPEEIRASLPDAFPRWWLPERWVVLPELPLTSVGKYDKRRMRALYAEGALRVDRI